MGFMIQSFAKLQYADLKNTRGGPLPDGHLVRISIEATSIGKTLLTLNMNSG